MALLTQQFPRSCNDTNLVRAAQAPSFKCQLWNATTHQLRQLPLPLLVELISLSPSSSTTAISQSASFRKNMNDWGKTPIKLLRPAVGHAGGG